MNCDWKQHNWNANEVFPVGPNTPLYIVQTFDECDSPDDHSEENGCYKIRLSYIFARFICENCGLRTVMVATTGSNGKVIPACVIDQLSIAGFDYDMRHVLTDHITSTKFRLGGYDALGVSK